MKRSAASLKTASKLSESLNHQLISYALAAGAAGVGALALSQSAEAKIVYTPVHRVIGPHSSYRLDLNHDGITDFTLLQTFTNHSGSGGLNCLFAAVRPGNAVVGTVFGHFGSSASALSGGVSISRRRKFVSHGRRGEAMVCTDTFFGSATYAQGPWLNVTRRYLGLKFKILGKTHYGWARLNVKTVGKFDISATLTGYAYETIPYKRIIAGKMKGPDDESSVEQPSPASLSTPIPAPATLGLLAIGSPALFIWRRKESGLEGAYVSRKVLG
jgi:hypothetical protein